jgi:hypothetical protein
MYIQINRLTIFRTVVRLCDYIMVEYLAKLIIAEFTRFLQILQVEKATVFSTR